MHPAILERLAATNLEQTPGYRVDEHCQRARAYIRRACQAEAEVQFWWAAPRPTPTVIAATLRPHRGDRRADRAYPTSTRRGHPRPPGTRCSPPPPMGRSPPGPSTGAGGGALRRGQLRARGAAGQVYLSPPSSTLYSLSGWRASGRVCRQRGSPVCGQGAHGLQPGRALQRRDAKGHGAADGCVLHQGAPKVGAMFGEAVVISNPAIAKDFPLPPQAARGYAGQGAAAGRPV